MLLRNTLGVLIIGLFFGIVWVIADIFVIGLNPSTAGSHLIYISAMVYAALFIFSFLASRFALAKKVKILYKLFNMLTAIVFYFLPVAVVLSIVLALGNFSLEGARFITLLSVRIAVLLGLIGILQARLIKTVRHTVVLKGAPESWNGRTAVLVSDTHFGLVNHARFSRRVVQKIKELKPHFILHAGDFYDGPDIDLPPVTDPWKELMTAIPTFYTPGNHEMYGPYEKFVRSVTEAGSTTLLDSVTEYDGVQIAGITYRDRLKKKEAEEAIAKLSLDPAKPAILINHPPTFHRAVSEKGFQLMVSGHTHGGQFWPVNYIVWMMYGKYTYGKHTYNNLTALTTRGVGTAGPPCRLFVPPEVVLLEFKIA